MSETKADREAREAAESNATVELSNEVVADEVATAREKRAAEWTPPQGHTTRLDPAIVELGDALVVDESLPADGIVESPRPELDGVMTAHTVYAEFAKPDDVGDGAAAGDDADQPKPAKKAPAKKAPAKKAAATT